MQLGPVIRSPLAKLGNLHMSYLERLCSQFEIYKRHPEEHKGTEKAGQAMSVSVVGPALYLSFFFTSLILFPLFSIFFSFFLSAFGGYNRDVITKLVRNYRSHPAILSLPSAIFYDNDLEACADEALRECMCQWDGLPNKGFPLVFHGVEGKDEREGM